MRRFGKIHWLDRLERVRYEGEVAETEDPLEHMTLASALLALANINHAEEYRICRAVAKHRLGNVPEPDDADLGEA